MQAAALSLISSAHGELALHKLDELMATRRDQELDTKGLDRVAKVLEGVAEFERAVQILERLRQQDPAYPKLASRIEELRQQASQDIEVASTPGVPGATVFSQEFRYEILDELGRGGMGVVFRARDRRLGRVVALKRLPDNLRNHPKAVELFLREARAAAALNHPNIVTLFDAGQDGDTFYLTMELLEGMPLQRVLNQRGSLSPAHVAKLGGQVATGLHYAHEQGIVHRDIKTANLFFTNKKLVKIMDFGLAKMVEEVRRATTVIGGTPYYMAPEQSAGEAIDIVEVKRLMELRNGWANAPNKAVREAIWSEMLDIHAQQVYSFGLVQAVPQPVVVNRTLRNVPDRGIYNWEPGAHFGLYRPDTFWFDGDERVADTK